MHRRLFIALAGLLLGTGVYAANSTSRSSPPPDQPSVSGSQNTNTSDMSGQSQPNTPTTNRPYYNTGADAGTARSKNSKNPNETGSTSGGAAGGYVAAGIGIAALIGLFASRRGRDTTTRRDDYHDEDDISRPGGGVGPTTRM